MASVPRPLIALLIGTIVFFGLWMTALKPSSSNGGPSGPQGLGQYQSAVNKAHAVQGIVNGAAARDAGTPGVSAHPGATTTATPASPAKSSSAAGSASSSSSPSHKTSPPAHSAPSAPAPTGTRLAALALRQHKVLAVLFYNSGAPDDRAVKQELAQIPAHNGAVVKMAVPIGQVGSYSPMLAQVPVNYSPTLVIVDRAGQAEEIAGFADSFELDHRVAAALATHPATSSHS